MPLKINKPRIIMIAQFVVYCLLACNFKLTINGRCYLKQITEGVTTSSELKNYATFRGVKDSTFIKCLNLFIYILNYYQLLSDVTGQSIQSNETNLLQ